MKEKSIEHDRMDGRGERIEGQMTEDPGTYREVSNAVHQERSMRTICIDPIDLVSILVLNDVEDGSQASDE